MNRVVLLSIKPKYAEKIFCKKKTVELRKRLPKQLKKGDLILVYVSSPKKHLVGAFTVKSILCDTVENLWMKVRTKAGVTKEEYETYFNNSTLAFGIMIDVIWSFDAPVSLNTLRSNNANFVVPQSFRYLKENEAIKLPQSA